jgi:hypothetical protein
MNALGDDGCPDLSNDLVQIDGAYVLQVGAACNFSNKANDFVFHPERDRSLLPDIVHVLINNDTRGFGPALDHAGCGSR